MSFIFTTAYYCFLFFFCLPIANSTPDFKSLRAQWESKQTALKPGSPSPSKKFQSLRQQWESISSAPKEGTPPAAAAQTIAPNPSYQSVAARTLEIPAPSAEKDHTAEGNPSPSAEQQKAPALGQTGILKPLKVRPPVPPKPLLKPSPPVAQKDSVPDLTPTYNRSRLIDSLKLSLNVLYTPDGEGLLTKTGAFLLPNAKAQQALKDLGFSNAVATQMIFSTPQKRLETVSRFKEEHKEDVTTADYKRMVSHTHELLQAVQEHNREIKGRLSSTKDAEKQRKIGNFYLLVQEHRLLDIYQKITSKEPLIESDTDAYISDINLIAAMYNAVIAKIDRLP